MKKDKKFFICAMLVLLLFLCINASSATEPLNETLGADTADELAVDDVSSDDLGASGDTFVVDSNGGDGVYSSISAAVGAATGGETIFIKNGNYTESAKMTLTKSLSFVGESRDGVIIKSTATNGVFETTESGVVLSFKNLNFKDISAGSIGTINVGGDSNLDIIDCTFDNCKSKYGAMWIKTTATANIEGCKILNSEGTVTKGATAIYLQSAGTYNIKDTVIDNAQYTGSSGFGYATVYIQNGAATVTLDNVLISNCGGNVYATVYSQGNTTVRNSRIINNTVPGATGNTILRSGKYLTVEQTVIANNTPKNYLILCNNGVATLNYNYIADNNVPTAIYGEGGNTHSINADSNYWGSNDLPSNLGTTVNNYVIKNDNGEYVLNTGEELEKAIPEPTVDGGEEPVEGAIVYVSVDGTGDGSSKDAAMSDFNQALEAVIDGGTIFICNGEYDIASPIMVNKNVSFVGESRDGVIMSCSANAGLFLIGYDMVNFEDLHLGSVSISGISFLNYDNLVAYAYSSVNEFNVTDCIIDPDEDDLIFIQVGITTMWDPSCSGTLNFKDNVLTSYATIAVYGNFNANINDNIMINGTVANITAGEVNADYNYWGNETPTALSLNNWIKFNAGTDTPEIYNDETATISICTTLNDGVTDASSHLPDYEITATLSADGTLSDTSVTLVNGAKDVTYSSAEPRSDNIAIEILGQSLTVPITVNERYTGIIYVSNSGNDDYNGSENAKVKTLAKAIELADKGSGQIIIDEGTYTIQGTNPLSVTKDLDITGVGSVIIDGESAKRIITNNANLNLTNLKFTGGSDTGACVLQNNGNATLESCELYSNSRTGYTNAIVRNSNQNCNLIINNTKFHENSCAYPIVMNGNGNLDKGGNVIINNSEFYNNDLSELGSSYGFIIYNAGGNVTVENTLIRNNKGNSGAIYTQSSGYSPNNVAGEVNIINTTFDSNAAGIKAGAIRVQDSKVNIQNSRFTNNSVTKNNAGSYGDGGAIYVDSGEVTIDASVFVNNRAENEGNDIYVYGGKLSMANSVILNSNSGSSIAKENSPTIDVNDNFWGDNTKANAGTGITVSRWIIMNAAYTPGEVSKGDEVTITAAFNQTNSSGGVNYYAGKIADGVNVTFASTTTPSIASAATVDGSASTTYTIRNGDEKFIITSSNDVVELPVIYKSPYTFIYVDGVNGDNGRDGKTRANAVKTIEHAYDIAPEGAIVYILNGTYAIESEDDDFGQGIGITKSVSFAGESTDGVILSLDNQARFIVKDEVDLSFKNITFSDGCGVNVIKIVSSFNELNITDCIFKRMQVEETIINVEGSGKLNIAYSYFESPKSVIEVYESCQIQASNNIFLADEYVVMPMAEVSGNFDYNYFGKNTRPAVEGFTVNYWVISTIAASPAGEVETTAPVTVTVDFNSYTDGNANTSSPNLIPDYLTVKFTAAGNLTSSEVLIENGAAEVTYSSNIAMTDTVTASLKNKAIGSVEITTVQPEIPSGTIFVDSVNGNDSNTGLFRTTPVKTLEHAVEIATADIVLFAGEYTVTSLLNITKDLNITGEGDVTVKSNAVTTVTYQEWDDWYEEWETKTKTSYTLMENNANLNITNIKFTLVPASITTADPLIVNNGNLSINASEFADIKITGYTGVIRNNNNMTVDNTKFTNSVAKYGNIYNYGQLLVNNSEFKDNVYTDTGANAQAICSNAVATIVNSKFTNNKGRTGGAVSFPQNVNAPVRTMDIINCTFTGNRADAGNGGAVTMGSTTGTLNIRDSTFSANTASTNGQACYVTGTTTIDKSVFLDNDIYVSGGTTDITDSIILGSGTQVSFSTYSSPTVTANGNWWGTNDQPPVAEGVTVDSWTKMTATFTPRSGQAGDEVTVTATFDNDNLQDGVIKVTFASSSNELYKTVTVNGAQASTAYTIDANDESITATSGDAVVVMPLLDPAVAGTVYVSPQGDDSLDGLTELTAIRNLTKAIELADANVGKIVLLEGVHVIEKTLTVSSDLDIRGIGEVVIDGNNKKIIANSANLNLTNIDFTNGQNKFGAAIDNDAAGNIIINECNFYSNVETSGGNGIIRNKGNLTINKSSFHENNALRGVIYVQVNGKLTINECEFYNNSRTGGYSAINVASSNGIVIENSTFRDNSYGSGGAIWIASSATFSVNIKNVTFTNNSATNGGAIGMNIGSGNVAVSVSNCSFIDNKATTNGGAIYSNGNNANPVITDCLFIGNTASGGNSIYVSNGELSVTNSVILNDGIALDKASTVHTSKITATENYWGYNTKANVADGITVANWVIMDASFTPANAAPGDSITITANFNKLNTTTGEVTDYTGTLPDGFNVTFTSTSGNLNEVVTVKDQTAGVAAYTVAESDRQITITVVGDVVLPFNLDAGKIFVLPGASDSNPGTRDSPVGSIAHAIEIATKGKIVLLEGTHSTGDLGTVSSDLTIEGEGKAVIDAGNNNRILFVGVDAKVVIINVTMINGYTDADNSGALLGNNNELTLINCTLANSTTLRNGGAIINAGKLTIINTTIANCTATLGGAVFSQCDRQGVEVTVINSTFDSNVANGKNMNGGGAIYAQPGSSIYTFAMTVDNSTFTNNKALGESNGGAISLTQLDATVKITDSEFIANHANGQDGYGGGAIYSSGVGNDQRYGTMNIEGTLFENNTCGANGGAIYARATTVNVAYSVIVDNNDINDVAVYAYSTDTVSPKMTLDDNWWGTNENPNRFVGKNTRAAQTVSRWAIMTVTNDTPIVAGSDVKFTVSINNYTDGETNGTLEKSIPVKRNMVLRINSDEIPITLENGAAECTYTIPEGTKIVSVSVDDETDIVYLNPSQVTVQISDIDAKKYEKVHVEINVTSDETVNEGNIALYVDGEKLIASINVTDGKAIADVVISEIEGTYNLTAKYVNGTLFEDNQTNATLTVLGIVELWNETFFNFFTDAGVLRSEVTEDELVFHGDFSGLGVDVITIDRSISIKGEDAKLYDMALSIQAGDSKVSDMTLIADGADFTMNTNAAIFAFGENIELNNVFVNYTAPSNVDAYGVLATSASGFKLIDSTIVFDSSNAGAVHHAVHITDSDNINITGNTVNASLPARDVDWHWTDPYFDSIDQDTVLAIGIQGSTGGILTENEINVETKAASGNNPTLDSIILYGVNDYEISWNNITQTDNVNTGIATCIYAVDLYAFNGITVKYNNIITNSTGGTQASGTAYPIQATGTYDDLVIDHNNLTSISNGPALGIYSTVGYSTGDAHVTDITVTFNNINVTGYASEGYSGLVSGMELQDTVAHVYNNTIYSQSKGDYNDTRALYGISYSQSAQGNHAFDIRDNTVSTDGKYAVYLYNAKNTNVTDNTLYAHELVGDESVNISSGENNVVKDNVPPFDAEIIITADNVWIGSPSTVVVNITGATGKVTIKVNDREFPDLELSEGIVSQIVDAADLISGENRVNVTFTSADRLIKSGEANSTFWVLDGIVTQETYMFYFNQDDNGVFFDYVPEGATLDFQGSIINPDQANVVQMNVNKPVNIISTTEDAYVDLNTTAGSLYGESPGNSFAVTRGGSGTNVTGIYFHNTQVWISNTSDVVLDNISVVVEDQRVGSGVGATTIRDNSTNVILKNSYLYTRNNGGSSTFTLSWATNCTIDNCTIKGEGTVGNLVYLNVYNIANYPNTVVSWGSVVAISPNNYNKVINNRIYSDPATTTPSVGLMVEGTYNLIQNNTFYKSSIGNSFGASGAHDNIYVANTMTEGGSLTAQTGSTVYNNNVTGGLTTGADSVAYNNTVGGAFTASANAVAYNNTVGGALSVAAGATVYNNTAASMKTSGANSVIRENEINGAVTIGNKNTTFANNNVTGLVTVNADENRIVENTIISADEYAVDLKTRKNNNVTDNILYANVLNSDSAVKYSDETNIVKDNYPRSVDVLVEATDVFPGQATTVTVTVANATGNVTIRVNGREVATENLTDGSLTFQTDEYGDNFTVNVTYNGDLTHLPNTNAAEFHLIGNVVTNDTFYTYFDEAGILRDEVSYDELIFEGEFSDLGAGYVIVTKPVTITSDDAVLNDLGIVVDSSDVKIDGLTLIANGSLGDLISVVEKSNVVLSNLSISYIVGDEEANAINVVGGSEISIINSDIYFESHVTADSKQTTAINIDSESEEILIENNNIVANLPALFAQTYDWTYFGMGLTLVNPVRVYEAETVEIRKNNIDVTINDLYRTTPTVQALYVAGSYDVVIDGNNITMIDEFTPEGKDVYLYAVEIYFDSEVVFTNNNVNMSTNGGKDIGAGAAYPLNIISSDVEVKYNNLTTVSNGPNLGIYFPTGFGRGKEVTVESNNIDVTGVAGKKDTYALVSGIEVQIGTVNIYKNNITTQNKGAYNESYYVTGVGIVQSGAKTTAFDIKDNNIVTDGHYAVMFTRALNSVSVTDNYLISADLYGDYAVYAKDSTGFEIENNRPYDPQLTIKVDNITVGEDALINVSTDENANGVAVVIVDGKSYTVDIINGAAESIVVSDLSASDYTVSAAFTSSDINYGYSKNSTVFSVAKLDSEISIAFDEDALVGDSVNITVSIPGATGNVTVIVNGRQEDIPLDENGNATYAIEEAEAGDYYVVAVYPGDREHAFAYESGNFTVAKFASPISVEVESPVKVGEETSVTVNVPDGATGTVIIDINGTLFAVNIEETNSITRIFAESGEYSVVAYYEGDDRYNENVSEARTLSVTDKADANISITVPDDIKVNETIEISVSADTYAELVVTIDGEPYAVENGKVKFTPAASGLHNITVESDENAEFKAGSELTIFVADKKDAEITIDEITAGIGDKVSVAAHTESDGALTVKINGETVTGEYEITKAGLYVVTVESAETDTYNEGFATSTFTVAKLASGVNVSVTPGKAGEKSTVKVNVTEGATGSVVIDVNGTKYVIGSADELELILDAGEYSVVASYEGDDKYGASVSDEVLLTVEDKKSANISIEVPQEAEAGETITIYVTADTDAELTLTVNGEEQTIIYANGPLGISLGDVLMSVSGKVDYTVAGEGIYNVTVTAAATEEYASQTVTKLFKANKKDAEITIDEITAEVGDSITVSAHTDSDGALTIKINGEEVTGEYEITKPGTYTVTAESAETDAYNKGFAVYAFTVDESEVVLKDTPVDIAVEIVDSNVTITVTVDENATGFVRFNVTGAEEYVLYAEVSKGVAVLDDVLANGEYTVTATYLGDSQFAANSTSDDFTIVGHIRDDTEISADATVEASTVTIDVAVDPSATGSVTIGVSGQTFIVDVNEGKATFTYNFLPGIYEANVTYLGDDNFNDAATAVSFTVVKQDADLKNTTITAEAEADENAVAITATVDSLATGLVEFKINGNAVYIAINNGKAVYNVVLPAGEYAVEVTYLGDDRYNGNSTSVAFNVSDHVKQNTTIVPEVEVDGNDVTITVSVDKAATGFVEFTIGENSLIVEVEDGKAVLNVFLETGNYDVTAAYRGDDEFNANSTEFEVTVDEIPLMDTPIDVTVEITDNNVSIQVTVDENATGFVRFNVTGAEEYVLYAEVENGTAVLEDVLTSGDYTVVATYLGDGRFSANSTSEEFTIVGHIRDDTEISADATVEASTVTVNVEVDANATGDITISVLGQTFIVPVDGGKAVFTYDFLPGIYDAAVTYLGDENFNQAATTVAFTVIKQDSALKNTTITVNVETIDNNVTVTATVDALATGIVQFTIDGKAVYIAVNNGKAVYELVLPAGEYTVEVTYLGDDRYNANATSEGFNVTDHVKQDTAIDCEVAVDGNDVTVTVIVDANATGPVVFELNGQNITVQVKDGQAVLNTVLPFGEHTIGVTYLGDSEFNENSTSITVNVEEPEETSAKITVPEDIKAGEDGAVTVEIPGATGEVTVIIDGEEISVPLDENGTASVPVEDVAAGEHSVVVIYPGDDTHAPTHAAASFTVPEEAVPEPVESVANITVPEDIQAGEDGAVTVEIPGATGNVSVIIDGEEISVPLDENGTASVPVEDVGAGEHSVVVIYPGDDTHASTHAAAAFTVPAKTSPEPVEAGANITAPESSQAGETPEVTVELPEDATGNVSVIVDGREVANVPVENATASIPLENLTAGEHTVEVKYSGDGKYAPESQTSTLTVEKARANITATGDEITEGEVASVSVTVDADATGLVLVDVNANKFYGEIRDGKASVNVYGLTNGTFTAAVIYLGDDKYANASTTAKITVAARQEPVTPQPVETAANVTVPENIKAGENATVGIDIPGATGNVTVIVDGKESTVALDENGTASVPISEVGLGDHSVVVIYPGDDTHAPTYAAKSFTVQAPEAVETKFVDMLVADGDLTARLVDADGKAVPDADIVYVIDGKQKTVKTAKDGAFTIKDVVGKTVLIRFDGKESYLATNTSVSLEIDPTPVIVTPRLGTVLIAPDNFTQYSCDHSVGERGRNFTGQLLDSNGVPLVNKTIQIGYNGINFNRTTNATGHFSVQIGLQNAGLWTFAMSYLGDDNYNASFIVKGITIIKKPTSIEAKNKAFKAKTKTKKYTVTLKTILGASIDGKVYLKQGKKLTLKVNGKTFKAKTGADGKATFKITNLNKKGVYKAKVKFAGDTFVYNKSKAKVKLTVK